VKTISPKQIPPHLKADFQALTNLISGEKTQAPQKMDNVGFDEISRLNVKVTQSTHMLGTSFEVNPEEFIEEYYSDSDNPNNVPDIPNRGNVGITRLLGKVVTKGVYDLEAAEEEKACADILGHFGENVAETKILSGAALDTIHTNEPETEGMEVIVMPQLKATNLSEILINEKMVNNLKKDISGFGETIGKMAFKDILIGNTDRFVKAIPKNGGALLQDPVPNLGNVMFGTHNGKVSGAIAIDNMSTSRKNPGDQEEEVASFKDLTSRLDEVANHIMKGILDEITNGLEYKDITIQNKLGISENELSGFIRKGLDQGMKDVKAAGSSGLDTLAGNAKLENTKNLIKLVQAKVAVLD